MHQPTRTILVTSRQTGTLSVLFDRSAPVQDSNEYSRDVKQNVKPFRKHSGISDLQNFVKYNFDFFKLSDPEEKGATNKLTRNSVDPNPEWEYYPETGGVDVYDLEIRFLVSLYVPWSIRPWHF